MPVLIMQSVPISETAAANGLNTVVRSIGTSTCSATVAAVLTAGTVAGGLYPSEGALHSMSWLAAVAAFLGAGVAVPDPRPALARPRRACRRTRRTTRARARRLGPPRGLRRRGRGARPGPSPRRPGGPAGGGLGARPERTTGRLGARRQRRPLVGRPARRRGVPRRLRRRGLGGTLRARHLSPESAPLLEIDQRLTVAGVVSRGGWPIDDALVVLTDASGESVGATRTDADGHYELGLPPLGRYVLTALDPRTGTAESEDVVISAQRRRFEPGDARPAGRGRLTLAGRGRPP